MTTINLKKNIYKNCDIYTYSDANINSLNKRGDIIFIMGMPANNPKNKDSFLDSDFSENKIIVSLINEGWICHVFYLKTYNLDNKNLNLFLTKNIVKLTSGIINYIVNKMAIKSYIIHATSFGCLVSIKSIPFLKKKPEKIIFNSPVFTDSIVHLNFKLKKEEFLLNNIVNQKRNPSKWENKLRDDYRDFSAINTIINIQSLILYGENESYKSIENNLNFSNLNNSKVKAVKNCGHLVMRPNLESPEEVQKHNQSTISLIINFIS